MFTKNSQNKSLEELSSEEIKEFQNEKLREQIEYLAEHSTFYKSVF